MEKYSSRTPHLAGCWESLNKCFQKSVDAVLPYNRFPTDEMLITIFTETECIIKSRPYILELNKPDVLPSSTPYFNAKYMKQQSLFLVNCFWRRFIKELNLSVGDLGFSTKIREWSSWPIEKVENVFPGQDTTKPAMSQFEIFLKFVWRRIFNIFIFLKLRVMKKTTFTLPGRPLYQYKVMTFGLCNAAQTICLVMKILYSVKSCN